MTDEKRDLPSDENSASNEHDKKEETIAEKNHTLEVISNNTEASAVQEKQPVTQMKKWTERISRTAWKTIGVGVLCFVLGVLAGNLFDHNGNGEHRAYGDGNRYGHQQEFMGRGGEGGRSR